MGTVLISLITGALIGGGAVFFVTVKSIDRNTRKEFNKLIRDRDRYREYYALADQWTLLKQEGISLTEYFDKNEIKKIAIYGLTELGNRLYDELKGSGTIVRYAVDRGRFCCPIAGLEMYSPEELTGREDLNDIDVMVVTPVASFEKIRNDMSKRVSCRLISLKSIIEEL